MNTPVIGLDLSIAATGLATDLCIATIGPRPGAHGDARLNDITAQVLAHVPVDALVVMESPVLRSAAALALGMLHGAVRHELRRGTIAYVEVAPAALKKFATGKGNAGKPEMAVALYKRATIELADDNQVDATWLRYAGLTALGQPPFPLPAAQVAALEKVSWPTGVR